MRINFASTAARAPEILVKVITDSLTDASIFSLISKFFAGSSSANRSSQKYMDSGKSSDSSLSSVQGYLRMQKVEGGSLRIGNVHNKKHGSDNK